MKHTRLTLYLPPALNTLLAQRAASVAHLAGGEVPLPIVARGMLERGLTMPDLPPGFSLADARSLLAQAMARVERMEAEGAILEDVRLDLESVAVVLGGVGQ